MLKIYYKFEDNISCLCLFYILKKVLTVFKIQNLYILVLWFFCGDLYHFFISICTFSSVKYLSFLGYATTSFYFFLLYIVHIKTHLKSFKLILTYKICIFYLFWYYVFLWRYIYIYLSMWTFSTIKNFFF